MGAFHPLADVGGGDGAHIVDGGQLLLRGLGQGLHGAEAAGQDLGGLFAHLPDAQGENQTPQVVVPAFIDGGHGVGGGLLAHALQGGDVGGGQVVQVGGGFY